ncbi:hypothetical protein HY734_03055 [Candidatus Uhrbacteria bacterium]|nr:hypothetical protein [Candidatus Uhrbacteria bacterium]
MNDILLGGAIGGLVAFLLTLPAIAFEVAKPGPVDRDPLVADVKKAWHLRWSGRGILLAGLFLHVLVGVGYGGVYPLLVERNWRLLPVVPYSLPSLLFYAVGVWLAVGIVLLPLLRFGLFGRRLGPFVWLEFLISMLLIAVGMWLGVQYYQPSFFHI